MTTGLGGKVMTYEGENRPLSVSHNGVASYLHRDQLASVRAISTAAGLKARRTTYKPFGEFTDLIANHLVDSGGTARIVLGVGNFIDLNGWATADFGIGDVISANDFIFA